MAETIISAVLNILLILGLIGIFISYEQNKYG